MQKIGLLCLNCMQHSLVQCYRCHIFGHIARNYMTILPSQKNQVVDRQNLLKPITIAEKAVWRDKKKSIVRSIETRKQIGKEKRNSNNLYVLDEHNSDICNKNLAKPHAEDVVKRLRTLLGVVPSH